MSASIEKRAIAEVPAILATFLEILESKVSIIPQIGKTVPDLVVEAAGRQFLVECKSTSARAPLLMAAQQIAEIKDSFQKEVVPLIVVPYMGKSGSGFCRDHELSWIDLSGNAHIKVPGLLIHVEGRPNRFKNVGRPANLFAKVPGLRDNCSLNREKVTISGSYRRLRAWMRAIPAKSSADWKSST